MTRRLLFICAVCMGCAAAQVAHPDSKIPLAERILGKPQRIAPYDVLETPAGMLALAALQLPACSALVSGPYPGLAEPRFRNTAHDRVVADGVSAEVSGTGGLHVLYAHANPDPEVRKVLLLAAYFKPEYVLTLLASGGAERKDSLPEVARALALLPGMVTANLLRA
jgi:hypothetical protein